MSERFLRRKLTFHAHGRTLVLVKRPSEKLEHPLMMALLWALYLPRYPDLRVEVSIGLRYKPDLVQLDDQEQPVFWGEAGEVGIEKLRTLCTRYRSTHLVFAKWNTNLHHFIALIEPLLKNVRRDSPIDVVGFNDNAMDCISETGEISVAFEDMTYHRLEGS